MKRSCIAARTRRTVALVLAAAGVAGALAATGCRDTRCITARYRLERAMWNAQLVERRIRLAMVPAGRAEVARAIEAFEAIASDPALARASACGPDVAADLRRMRTTVESALATLYLVEARYVDASRAWRATLRDARSPALALEAHVGLARALALAGDREALALSCDSLMRRVENDPAIRGGAVRIPPEVFQAPVLLVRIRREQGSRDALERARRRSTAFCDALARDFDGTPTAAAARMAALQVQLAAERWPEALERIDGMLGDPATADRRAELGVLAGEILLNALDRPADALARFDAAIAAARSAGGAEAVGDVARFDRALALAELGRDDEAEAVLRDLSTRASVDAEVAARAMLVRARRLERAGKWDEALVLLRRVTSIHPDTDAALDAPLVITAHYASRGEEELAHRSLERALSFYEERLDRAGTSPQRWLDVTDRLVDAFGVADRGEEAARWLVRRAESNRGDDGALALLRAAWVYADVLDDAVRARELFEKCVERYPETRYAEVARDGIAQLDSLTPARSESRP